MLVLLDQPLLHLNIKPLFGVQVSNDAPPIKVLLKCF